MKRPEAILFDHDGVLVASEPLHAAAWKRLLTEIGLPFVPGDLRLCVGGTAPQTISVLLDKYRPGWKPSEFDPEALAARKNEFYLKAANLGLEPYPGVVEGLRWLRQNGIKAAVVSNARRKELCGALDRLQLTPWFDSIVSREDAGICKPDPGPYLLAAANIGIDPSHCIAIEDSPTGLEAALRAKIPCVGVLTNFDLETLSYPILGMPHLKPDRIFASIEEFFAFLERLP